MVIGISLGIISARKQYSALDYLLDDLCVFLDFRCRHFFSRMLGMLRFRGAAWLAAGVWHVDTRPTERASIWICSSTPILPVMALAIPHIAEYMRYARAATLEAHGRRPCDDGARERVARAGPLFRRHVFRNALMPLMTIAGLSIPGVISGSFIIETIFSWPGIGMLGYTAIMQRDYPVQLGIALMAAIVVLFATCSPIWPTRSSIRGSAMSSAEASLIARPRSRSPAASLPNDAGDLARAADAAEIPSHRLARDRRDRSSWSCGLRAIFAPLLAPYDPNAINLRCDFPTAQLEHLFGTDTVGRDTFSRALYGARISLSVGVLAVAMYMTIGFMLGAISGYFGGFVDTSIMRFTEIMMCFPTFVLILILVGMVGPNMSNIILVHRPVRLAAASAGSCAGRCFSFASSTMSLQRGLWAAPAAT